MPTASNQSLKPICQIQDCEPTGISLTRRLKPTANILTALNFYTPILPKLTSKLHVLPHAQTPLLAGSSSHWPYNTLQSTCLCSQDAVENYSEVAYFKYGKQAGLLPTGELVISIGNQNWARTQVLVYQCTAPTTSMLCKEVPEISAGHLSWTVLNTSVLHMPR